MCSLSAIHTAEGNRYVTHSSNFSKLGKQNMVVWRVFLKRVLDRTGTLIIFLWWRGQGIGLLPRGITFKQTPINVSWLAIFYLQSGWVWTVLYTSMVWTIQGLFYIKVVIGKSVLIQIDLNTIWLDAKTLLFIIKLSSKRFAICSVFEVNFFEKCWIMLWWFQTVSTLTVEVGLAVGTRKCTQRAKLFEVLSFTPGNSQWMLQTVFNSSTLTKLIWFPAQVLFLYNSRKSWYQAQLSWLG